MKINQKGFNAVMVLVVLLVLGGVAAAGWYVLNKQKKNDQPSTSQQANEPAQSEESTKSMSLETAPMVSVSYDPSWSRLTEYGYNRDGLTKTVDGVDFLIKFTRTFLDYDYMDRTAGGAYPPGTLYKEITANRKPHYIGITEHVPGAFLSTCKPSEDGACSLHLPDNYGYMIVDISRFAPTDSDYKATEDLVLDNAADKKAIDEFAEIMTTLKY